MQPKLVKPPPLTTNGRNRLSSLQVRVRKFVVRLDELSAHVPQRASEYAAFKLHRSLQKPLDGIRASVEAGWQEDHRLLDPKTLELLKFESFPDLTGLSVAELRAHVPGSRHRRRFWFRVYLGWRAYQSVAQVAKKTHRVVCRPVSDMSAKDLGYLLESWKQAQWRLDDVVDDWVRPNATSVQNSSSEDQAAATLDHRPGTTYDLKLQTPDLSSHAFKAVIEGGLAGLLNEASKMPAAQQAAADIIERIRKDRRCVDTSQRDWEIKLGRGRATIVKAMKIVRASPEYQSAVSVPPNTT